MKRFIGKVLFFLMFCMVIQVIIPVVVDPYNIFHWNSIRNNGIEPNKNYIKTKYIIANPDKFDGFLFGSSRVGAIHVEKISDQHIYNMTYSVGTPQEHLETLRTFLDEGVNVDVVYMGVDSTSYAADASQHIYEPIRCPYQYLTSNPMSIVYLYLDPSLVVRSIKYWGREIEGYDVFYDYGWWYDYGRSSTIDWNNVTPFAGSPDRMGETLQVIQEMKDICDGNMIQLVIFTNPLYQTRFTAAVEKGYLEFLDRLADITEYYNFSGINDITVNTDNYIDDSHYNAYIGDVLIDVMCNDSIDESPYDQGFGWYVTSENVDDLLTILRQNAISRQK